MMNRAAFVIVLTLISFVRPAAASSRIKDVALEQEHLADGSVRLGVVSEFEQPATLVHVLVIASEG